MGMGLSLHRKAFCPLANLGSNDAQKAFRLNQAAAEAQFMSLEIQEAQLEVATENNLILHSVDSTLKGVFGELKEVNSQLDDIRKASLENLEIVKRERALKEVLFQLGNLLDDVEQKKDIAGTLLAAKMLLRELDKYKLGTNDLADFEDKKLYTNLVNRAKAILKNASNEQLEDVNAFEINYLLYLGRKTQGFLAPPLDGPFEVKVFKPKDAPRFEKGQLPAKPVLVIPIAPDKLGSKKGLFGGDQIAFPDPGPPPSCPPQTSLPDGYKPPDLSQIPSEESTNSRLPASGKWFGKTAVDRARDYEAALREWAARVDAHQKAMRDWRIFKAAAEEKFKSEVGKWEKNKLLFEEKEQVRKEEHEKSLERHREKELERRREHDAESKLIEARNHERQRKLDAARLEFEKLLEKYREFLNDYMEQNPGLQYFYQKL